jgi:hypothetical protein
MFDYNREKAILDYKLNNQQMNENQYQTALYYLNEAYAKNQQNQDAFRAGLIDGLTYNKREAEIVKEYDMKSTEKKVNVEKQKKAMRNLWGFVALGLGIIIAAVVIVNVSEGYKHRSVKGIPEPIQAEATGKLSFEIDYTSVELEYMYSYELEGIVIVKEKEEDDNDPYKVAVPYIYGMAWDYAAEHNDEITWGYNNRNLKAKEFKNLDRIKIQETSSINEIIPADETVRRDLDRYGPGDHLRITGNLVKIHAYNAVKDYYVVSSEVRGDVTEFILGGKTANEIIYATKVEKLADKEN